RPAPGAPSPGTRPGSSAGGRAGGAVVAVSSLCAGPAAPRRPACGRASVQTSLAPLPHERDRLKVRGLYRRTAQDRLGDGAAQAPAAARLGCKLPILHDDLAVLDRHRRPAYNLPALPRAVVGLMQVFLAEGLR